MRARMLCCGATRSRILRRALPASPRRPRACAGRGMRACANPTTRTRHDLKPQNTTAADRWDRGLPPTLLRRPPPLATNRKPRHQRDKSLFHDLGDQRLLGRALVLTVVDSLSAVLRVLTVDGASKATACAEHLKDGSLQLLGVGASAHGTGHGVHIIPANVAIVRDVLNLTRVQVRYVHLVCGYACMRQRDGRAGCRTCSFE